ncbi:aspartic proteinase NANA, chloroplast [Prosopis cineraria]|uniref:aspartic proteinase NANA, chloroplast n=1 Tax=Prosopis cineraria TaxID=364024 RepID=UPI0024109E75|nr:aspartic proteinase NANA, chloroplast [Prosopis cineraria]
MKQQRKKKTTRICWIPPISLVPICCFLFLPIIAHSSNDQTSATMRLELVHRHDPRVQFHGRKQSLDRFERVKELAHRDMIRHTRRKVWETFEMPMHAGRDLGAGVYFVQVKVGTPFQRFWLIADSGSDLTWFNCNYKPQNFTSHRKRKSQSRRRVFSPHRSRTFQPVACSSQECKVDLSHLNSLRACPNSSAPCLYDYRYLDGSGAMGLFGRDTFTVGLTNGRKGKLRNMIIGCTRSVIKGPTVSKDIDGLLGLGLSDDSFVATAASQYGGKFSYCLVDHLSHKNVSNFLTFGTTISKASLLREIHTTPLVVISSNYGLNVVGISIGDRLLRIPQIVWDFNANGGAILDSGTSLTLLAMPAYVSVMEALVKPLDAFEKMKAFEPFEYCYSKKGFNESLVPRLAFHFEGGARFEPPVKSYVIDVSPKEKCIGIVGIDWPGVSIIGNIMQQNHLWEFDLFHNTVSFAPSPC